MENSPPRNGPIHRPTPSVTGGCPARDCPTRRDLTLNELRLAEVKESIAGQAPSVVGKLGLNSQVSNANRGAMILGSSPGCSGERFQRTLPHMMI